MTGMDRMNQLKDAKVERMIQRYLGHVDPNERSPPKPQTSVNDAASCRADYGGLKHIEPTSEP